MKKRTKWKRVLAAVLSLTLLTGVLGACGEEEAAFHRLRGKAPVGLAAGRILPEEDMWRRKRSCPRN